MIFIEPGSLVCVDRNEMWHGEAMASKSSADRDAALLSLVVCLGAAALKRTSFHWSSAHRTNEEERRAQGDGPLAHVGAAPSEWRADASKGYKSSTGSKRGEDLQG